MELTKRFNTWREYVPEALHTASMGKGRELEGMVRVTGLCGEAAELTEAIEAWKEAGAPDFGHLYENLTKELGDVCWYLAALDAWGNTLAGVMLADFDTLRAVTVGVMDTGPTHVKLLTHAGQLAEFMKKHLGHDKPFDAGRFRQLLSIVLVDLQTFCIWFQLDLGEVCAANVAKLRARFKGGGFNAALSAVKLDERPALQADRYGRTVEDTGFDPNA